MRKALGMDYTNTTRVPAFFIALGLTDIFLMPPSYKTAVGYRILHSTKFMIKLPGFIKKYKIMVFSCPPYFHLPALFFTKLLGVRTISIVVDLYGEMAIESSWQGAPFKRALRKLLYPLYEASEMASIKLSDAIFCVSPYSVAKYSKFKKAVYRVKNGANVALISNLKPVAYKKDTIFYMGGFLKWKGIDLLVREFQKVREKHDVQLVLMGGSEEELKFYPELREQLAKTKDVVLIGYGPHEKAMPQLKGAKIAVMPARDVFMTRALSSVKVFEFIAAEVPQVCTDTGEHAEWVRKIGAGIVVKDTADDIARGIVELLENKKLYDSIKKNCADNKWQVDHKVLKAPLIKYFESLQKQMG